MAEGGVTAGAGGGGAGVGAAVVKEGKLFKRGDNQKPLCLCLSFWLNVLLPVSVHVDMCLSDTVCDCLTVCLSVCASTAVSVSGEHIKNWRERYFILKEDGQFIGFKNKPSQMEQLADPLNNFTVKGENIKYNLIHKF